MERAVGTLKRRRKRSPAPDEILKLAFAMACTLALLNEVFPSIAGRSKMPENTVGTIGVDDEVAAVVCDTSSCIAKASVAGDPRHTVFPSIAGRSKMPENIVGTIGDDEVVAVVCDTSSSIAKASVAADPRHTVFPSIAGRSKALRIKEREYGLEHREVAKTLTSLGNAYGYLGDAQAMRDLLKKALRIQEREYGAEHRQVATILMNLGSTYWDLGGAQKTRDLVEKALRIKEREYGHQHRQRRLPWITWAAHMGP